MAAATLALPNTGSHGRDVFFAIGLIFILTVLFVPIPPVLIDFGLALSVALSILILMVSLWIARPLDFSSFPTVLLIVTMLRLSLNIATTRLILSHGAEGVNAAGYVIGGFSRFVMSGDFVIGLIVFLILIVVNFVVITKGATRIAEVGARFTLDAIPGKQMSIDADLSAGIIDEREAQKRRRELEEESSFFGSMDGASKFVRGDAIAGLIITGINIIGGIVIGYARHGMELGEAVDVFTKLAVGDGLVTQIPALIVSLAAGLLVSKGGTRGSADKAVLGQLGAHPKALYIAASLLFVLAVLPGLPMLPFIVLSAMLASSAYLIPLRLKAEEQRETAAKEDDERKKAEQARDSVKSSLQTAEIEVVLGSQLSSKLLPYSQELAFRMGKMRKKFAAQYGFVIPEVHLADDFSISKRAYKIKVHGTMIAGYELRIGEIMVFDRLDELRDIPGTPVKEPAYGFDALSVPEAFADDLKNAGISFADGMSVLLTHLSEVVRNNLPQLLSYKDVKILVEQMAPEYRKLADDICTNHISYSGLQAVLKLLLAERISIRNLPLILEAIAEVAPFIRRSEQILEHVRQRISQQLCGDISTDGTLRVLRLGNRWDMAFHQALAKDPKGEVREFDIDPRLLEEFGTQAKQVIEKHSKDGLPFAIVTSPEARPYVRMIVERLNPNLPVLSHVEIAKGIDLQIIGSVA